MAAIGTKRTSLVALHMSAFDPKRTCRNAHSNAAKVSDQQSTSGYSRDCSHRADRLSFERS